jgi:hypothetical protein
MTNQDLGEITTAESISAALVHLHPTWITLPSRDEELPTELQFAVDDFDAGDGRRPTLRPPGYRRRRSLPIRPRAPVCSSPTVAWRASTRSRRLRSNSVSVIVAASASSLYECPQLSSPGSPRTSEPRSTASCSCCTPPLLHAARLSFKPPQCSSLTPSTRRRR